MKSINWLNLERKVRFGDCDSANVIHFHNLLKWSHEAWEESLEKYGMALKDIFPTNEMNTSQLDVALPVVHCEANYFQPLYVGDTINIELNTEKINESSFVLRLKFKKDGEQIGTTNIKHVSINPITRKKCALSKQINLWLNESILDF